MFLPDLTIAVSYLNLNFVKRNFADNLWAKYRFFFLPFSFFTGKKRDSKRNSFFSTFRCNLLYHVFALTIDIPWSSSFDRFPSVQGISEIIIKNWEKEENVRLFFWIKNFVSTRKLASFLIFLQSFRPRREEKKTRFKILQIVSFVPRRIFLLQRFVEFYNVSSPPHSCAFERPQETLLFA